MVWPKIAVLNAQEQPEEIPETDATGVQELEGDTNRLRYTKQGSIDTKWLYKIMDNAMNGASHGG